MVENRLVPDVSVVIPTKNRKEMLARAIESCWRAAADLALEVIVVDDGSEDGTAELVRARYPEACLLADREGGNRGRARNDGMAAAHGQYLKFLDDDDWLEPGSLAAEVGLARSAGADIVVGAYRVVTDSGEERRQMPPPLRDGIDALLRGESVVNGAALYRRGALSGVRWNEDQWVLDDWQFFLAAALAARRIVRLEQVVLSWYPHGGAAQAGYDAVEYARAFYGILNWLESELTRLGELTEARRRRLAQYRYKQLRVLALADRTRFEAEVREILRLDPGFGPVDEERQAWMRALARILGFRRALLLHTFVKRRVAWIRAAPGTPMSQGLARRS